MLSNAFTILLLSPVIIDFIIRLIKRQEELVKNYFSYAFLTFAIVFTLKIPAVSLSVIPIFIYKNYFKALWLIYALLVGYLTFNYNLLLLLGYVITAIGILLFSHFQERKEIHRKIVHIGLGCLIGYTTFLEPLYGIYFMVLLLIAGLFLYMMRGKYPVKFFLREYSKDGSGKEAFTLVIGILISSLIGILLGINPYFVAYYQAWVDGLSAIFGVESKGKSIRGLFGGIIGGVIAVLVTRTNPLLAIVVPLMEYTVRKVDDNLVIPTIAILIYVFLVKI